MKGKKIVDSAYRRLGKSMQYLETEGKYMACEKFLFN